MVLNRAQLPIEERYLMGAVMAKVKMGGVSYTPEARKERAQKRVRDVDTLIDLRGKRVLEVGCGAGDVSKVLADDYNCEVVAIDITKSQDWETVNRTPNLRFAVADIASPSELFVPNSFDRIISFVAWEHMRHPWSALHNCQQMLRVDGKKYLYSWLYGSAGASHLYSVTDDHWPHLAYSPTEVKAKYGMNELPWYYWCNRVSYQQYLFYFRKLGFFVTHEYLIQETFNEEEYRKNEEILSLYPEWDLRTDGFQVVLEFDKFRPKESILDPVYRLRNRSLKT